jgi:hypothetical protein
MTRTSGKAGRARRAALWTLLALTLGFFAAGCYWSHRGRCWHEGWRGPEGHWHEGFWGRCY